MKERLTLSRMLTMAEIGERLNVAPATVKSGNQAGVLTSHPYNDKNERLFEPPGEGAPVRGKHKGLIAALRQTRRSRKMTSKHHNEVQYEA